jgi:hypothetical protein
VDFLTAADAVYSKLGAGAKSAPRSRKWYGEKMALRKSDELLNYIHQAKNSDFHGLDDGLREGPPKLQMFSPKDPVPSLEKGKQLLINLNDKGRTYAKAIVTIGPMRLCPVTNRNVTFAVPRHHLGRQLTSGPIPDLTDTVCDYLTTLVDEATGLVEHE